MMLEIPKEGKKFSPFRTTAPEGTKGGMCPRGSPKKVKGSFPLFLSHKSPFSEGGGKRKGGKVATKRTSHKKGQKYRVKYK
jgi:hypothetical protein